MYGETNSSESEFPFWQKNVQKHELYLKGPFRVPFSLLLFLTTPVNFFQPNTFFSALLTARIVNKLLAGEATYQPSSC